MTGAVSTVEAVSGETDGDEVKAKPPSVRQKGTIKFATGEDDNRTDIEMVCMECFRFLKALANDYIEVQER